MKNDKICPEDMLRVLLRAEQIPDTATVSKRTGQYTYVLLRAEQIPDTATVSKRTGQYTYALKRNLQIYTTDPPAPGEKKTPTVIDGFFLVGVLGDINQVKSDTMLHWHVRAEDMVDELLRSWKEMVSQ